MKIKAWSEQWFRVVSSDCWNEIAAELFVQGLGLTIIIFKKSLEKNDLNNLCAV